MAKPERADRDSVDEDPSDTILGVVARRHPRRLDRQEVINEILSGRETRDPEARANLAKRLGRLISRDIIEERLTLNDGAARVGLSGRALIGVSLNIEALRMSQKNQNDIIDEILNETAAWLDEIEGKKRPVPPIVIRDISIVHGSDQFDILLTVLHSKETVPRPDRNEREDIIYYYVREVIQRRVDGVNGTRTMGLASSRAYPMRSATDAEATRS